MKHVIILGGGISGLAAAYFLRQHSTSHITLLEKENRVGGLIQSVEKSGVLFERGPRGFRPHGKGRVTLALVEKLGLKKQLLAASPHAQRRFLLHKGKLTPVTPWFFLKMGLPFALLREPFIPRASLEDESIGDFFQRRLGKKITQTLVDPLVSGIFGGDLWNLSMRSCFPSLHALEGSFLKAFFKRRHGLPPLYSFVGGMETLPRALHTALSPTVDIRLSTCAEKVTLSPDQVVVETATETFTGDHLISTLPPFVLAKLYTPTPAKLASIPYLTLTALNCAFSHASLPSGFGYLIPSQEKQPILGVTFDSHIFPRSPHTHLCVMMRGHQTAKTALNALSHHLTLPTPLLTDIHTAAIPQYTLGHHTRLQTPSPRLTLLGNYLHGVGINDCIASAT